MKKQTFFRESLTYTMKVRELTVLHLPIRGYGKEDEDGLEVGSIIENMQSGL